jgi:2,3-bisphosphoglycerate-independent phosphoglycerate mutase
VTRSHEAGVTDEFIEPTLVVPDGVIRDGDVVVHANFRADRARQLTRAFTEVGFDAFAACPPRLCGYATMTQYQADFDLPAIFPPRRPRDTVGEAFARAGWPQLRLAETEKYAHVTYFFNGGREEAFAGESRILVPSPRVATYDQTPAMAAREVTSHALEWIGTPGRRLLVMNYANADMVGHTGDFEATVAACEVVDEGVAQVAAAVREVGGLLIVTADHGNAERMLDERGQPHTAHTTSPVPVHLLDARPGGPGRSLALRDGVGLADLGATLLRLSGLPVPEVMASRGIERP